MYSVAGRLLQGSESAAHYHPFPSISLRLPSECFCCFLLLLVVVVVVLLLLFPIIASFCLASLSHMSHACSAAPHIPLFHRCCCYLLVSYRSRGRHRAAALLPLEAHPSTRQDRRTKRRQPMYGSVSEQYLNIINDEDGSASPVRLS